MVGDVGRPPGDTRRESVHALLSLTRKDITWRSLRHNRPLCPIVFQYLSWLIRSRPIAKSYQRTPESDFAFMQIAMFRLMFKRLAQKSMFGHALRVF